MGGMSSALSSLIELFQVCGGSFKVPDRNILVGVRQLGHIFSLKSMALLVFRPGLSANKNWTSEIVLDSVADPVQLWTGSGYDRQDSEP